MQLFEELKRRNVIRVGAAYVMAAWVILQFADLVLENMGAPDWMMQAIMLALAIGLPAALFLAWAFELTPDGIKSEKDVDRSTSIARGTGKRLDRIIIGILLLAIVLMITERFFVARNGFQGADPEIAAQSAKSIAVLPLADLSQNKDQGWFADGLAEEILNALARTPDLLVSSRTSAFAYKGSTKDIVTIAKELGVAHVLEGSVRRAGDRLRVTAQLIRANDGFHLWSQNYDRNAADVIDIQEDLAVQIATALKTKMDPAALKDMVRVGTRSVDAYHEYLRGLSKLAQSYGSYQMELAVESHEHFENARTIDPGFSEAHRKASQFWKLQLSTTSTMSGLTDLTAQEQFEAFQERINRAIETSLNRIDRDGMMAQKAIVDLRIRDAVRLQQSYVDARPNDMLAWKDLGDMAVWAWDLPTAAKVVKRLREVGQTSAIAAQWSVNLSYRISYPQSTGDYGLQSLQRWPTNLGLKYQTHRALLWEMRVDEAAALATTFDQRNGMYELVKARQDCAEGRRDPVMRAVKKRRDANIKPESTDWLYYMMLGDEDAAREVVRLYEVPGVSYSLLSWLIYQQFDPAPFPSLVDVIQREKIQRPPLVRMPFACPPAA